jgi:uncharacterized membrane protein
MSFFKKLGFEKGDERTIYIGFHAGRVTFIFTTAVLLVWSLQEILSTGSLSIQFAVLCASLVVFWLSYIYYTKKFGGK